MEVAQPSTSPPVRSFLPSCDVRSLKPLRRPQPRRLLRGPRRRLPRRDRRARRRRRTSFPAPHRGPTNTPRHAQCKYIQLDDTNLAYLCSDEMRAGAIERGEDIQQLPKQYASLINAALRDKPADMTAAIHLCRSVLSTSFLSDEEADERGRRGNFRSRSFSSGGYEPVAEGPSLPPSSLALANLSQFSSRN